MIVRIAIFCFLQIIIYNFVQADSNYQHSTICDQDVEVSINLINQFVRMNVVPLDLFKVIRVMEQVAVASGCNPSFFSFRQMRSVASMLQNEHISDKELWRMIELAKREQLESKVEAEPWNAWKFYSEALQLWPSDSHLRLELGKSLARVDRHDDAALHLRLAAIDSASFQTATFALASLLMPKDPDEAVNCYAALIAADASSEIPWLLLSDGLKLMLARDPKLFDAARLPKRLAPCPLPWWLTGPVVHAQDRQRREDGSAPLHDEAPPVPAHGAGALLRRPAGIPGGREGHGRGPCALRRPRRRRAAAAAPLPHGVCAGRGLGKPDAGAGVGGGGVPGDGAAPGARLARRPPVARRRRLAPRLLAGRPPAVRGPSPLAVCGPCLVTCAAGQTPRPAASHPVPSALPIAPGPCVPNISVGSGRAACLRRWPRGLSASAGVKARLVCVGGRAACLRRWRACPCAAAVMAPAR